MAEHDDDMVFVFGGTEYRASDLTLLDVVEIEDTQGDSIMELLGSGRMGPLLHMVWCIRRHSEPDITLEQVGAVTLGDLMNEAKEAGDPPTEAAAPAPKKSASAGARGSRSGTASARGKSDS